MQISDSLVLVLRSTDSDRFVKLLINCFTKLLTVLVTAVFVCVFCIAVLVSVVL